MKFVLTLLLLLQVSPPCLAWNRGGHLTSGAIAYRELAADHPEVVARVVRILKSHPTPRLLWGPAGSEAGEEAIHERLFMEMATWPDQVRPPSEYAAQFHRDTWHWINLVFLPPGSKFAAPAETVKDRLFDAFSKNAAIVADPAASDADKAVALCWIFHLVGDSHQPLHTTALFDEEFPEGDHGGNLTRVAPDGVSLNLHQYWDGAVLESPDPKAAQATAARLRAAYPRSGLPMLAQRPYRNAATFEEWGRTEAARLAVAVVYDEGRLLALPRENGVYQLTPGYVSRSKEVAERQATLAGYRLADVLETLLSPRTGPATAAAKPPTDRDSRSRQQSQLESMN